MVVKYNVTLERIRNELYGFNSHINPADSHCCACVCYVPVSCTCHVSSPFSCYVLQQKQSFIPTLHSLALHLFNATAAVSNSRELLQCDYRPSASPILLQPGFSTLLCSCSQATLSHYVDKHVLVIYQCLQR